MLSLRSINWHLSPLQWSLVTLATPTTYNSLKKNRAKHFTEIPSGWPRTRVTSYIKRSISWVQGKKRQRDSSTLGKAVGSLSVERFTPDLHRLSNLSQLWWQPCLGQRVGPKWPPQVVSNLKYSAAQTWPILTTATLSAVFYFTNHSGQLLLFIS